MILTISCCFLIKPTMPKTEQRCYCIWAKIIDWCSLAHSGCQSSFIPSRFHLDPAQNRGSLVELFTLNTGQGRCHGAVLLLIYSEDICLNYCYTFQVAHFQRAASAWWETWHRVMGRKNVNFQKITEKSKKIHFLKKCPWVQCMPLNSLSVKYGVLIIYLFIL